MAPEGARHLVDILLVAAQTYGETQAVSVWGFHLGMNNYLPPEPESECTTPRTSHDEVVPELQPESPYLRGKAVPVCEQIGITCTVLIKN